MSIASTRFQADGPLFERWTDELWIGDRVYPGRAHHAIDGVEVTRAEFDRRIREESSTVKRLPYAKKNELFGRPMTSAEAMRRSRARTVLASDDPRHGTASGASYCRPRCDACRAYNTEAKRRARDRAWQNKKETG